MLLAALRPTHKPPPPHALHARGNIVPPAPMRPQKVAAMRAGHRATDLVLAERSDVDVGHEDPQTMALSCRWQPDTKGFCSRAPRPLGRGSDGVGQVARPVQLEGALAVQVLALPVHRLQGAIGVPVGLAVLRHVAAAKDLLVCRVVLRRKLSWPSCSIAPPWGSRRFRLAGLAGRHDWEDI